MRLGGKQPPHAWRTYLSFPVSAFESMCGALGAFSPLRSPRLARSRASAPVARVPSMGCTNVFCIEPDEVDTTYFYILATVSFINCLVALATVYLVLCRVFRACCTAPKAAADTSQTPVAVVVPCYLPNEQGIIVSTIDHILTRLVHEGPLTLYVVYNTPPGFWWLEEELLRKASCSTP